MSTPGTRWALVLAAGDGTRLSAVTRNGSGVAVPKQYMTFWGDRCLLRHALLRARRVVAPERVVTIVAGRHEFWWRRHLADLPPENVVVQPANRGTAAGVLLPLLSILERDPSAEILVLPSDHFVADEELLAASAELALDGLSRGRQALTLLGISPDRPTSDYGWIEPAPEWQGGARRVARFVEKPPAELAEQLMRRGAVWNSFLFVARGAALRELYARRLPALLAAVEQALASKNPAVLEHLYAGLPSADFSRDVLAGAESELRLITVPRCGWTDLGTPERLAECLAALGGARSVPAAVREGAAAPIASLPRSHALSATA